MTDGEIYELNKLIYNEHALLYINSRLSKNSDMCHRPHEMKMYHKRYIIERVDFDIYYCFWGTQKDTTYNDLNEITSYTGEKIDLKICNLDRIIRMFGFEIAINPNSLANKQIDKNLVP
jgi:hypothetical protein